MQHLHTGDAPPRHPLSLGRPPARASTAGVRHQSALSNSTASLYNKVEPDRVQPRMSAEDPRQVTAGMFHTPPLPLSPLASLAEGTSERKFKNDTGTAEDRASLRRELDL